MQVKQKLKQLKLMKLVYIAQGIFLAETGRPLFAEPVEAWKYGPVIRELWRETQTYGSEPIDSVITDELFNTTPMIPNTDKETLQILNSVWEHFSEYSGIQLSNWTHQKDSPWDKTYGHKKASNIIGNDRIRKYFKSLNQ